MVKEAEEFAADDAKAREGVEARNQLESYLYALKSSAEDSLKDKLAEDDAELLKATVTEGLAWLDDRPSAAKDEYDAKREEVEAVANPIMSRAHGAGADAGDDAGYAEPAEENDEGPKSRKSRRTPPMRTLHSAPRRPGGAKRARAYACILLRSPGRGLAGRPCRARRVERPPQRRRSGRCHWHWARRAACALRSAPVTAAINWV